MRKEDISPAQARLLRLRALQLEADADGYEEASFQGIKWLLTRHALSETNAKLAAAQAEAKARGQPLKAMNKHFYLDMPDEQVGLEDEGKRQAQALGVHTGIRLSSPGPFRTETGVYIMVSPFERTLQTLAEMLPGMAGIHRIKKIDPRIREKDFGKWDGLSDVERRQLDPVFYDDVYKQSGSYYIAPPGGESGQMIERRVRAALIDAASNARDLGLDTVMVMTHRPVLELGTLILMGLSGAKVKEFPDDFGNCAMLGIIDRQVSVIHDGFYPNPIQDILENIVRHPPAGTSDLSPVYV